MSYYSFNMKKGKYCVEMVSDDVYFAERQVDKLFDSLLKAKGKMRVVLPPLPVEEKPEKVKKVPNLPEKPVLPEPEEQAVKEIKAEEKPEEVIKKQEVKEEEPEEEPVPVKEEVEEEEPPKKKGFSFKNIIKDKLAPSSPEEAPEAEIKPEIEETADTSKKPEEESITKILEEKIKKNLPPAEPESPEVSVPEEIEIEEEPEEDYAEMIPEIAEEDVSEIIKNGTFNSLEELISLKNPESKLDYLLVASYYLQTKENLFKYSLKQLNSKIMPFLGALIDHAVIHNAVAHDFIEVVPDYNGSSDVTEYKLTEEGETYLLQ